MALSLVLAVVTAAGLLWFLGWWHGVPDLPDSFSITLGGGELLVIVGTVVLTVVAHELIHALAARVLGYRIEFGFKWQMLAPYVAAFHQFTPRNHNLLIAIAPLPILTVIFLPLLVAATPLATVAAFIGLVINTSGAVGDLYLTWRLLRLPRATLLYDVSIDRMLIYLPAAPPQMK